MKLVKEKEDNFSINNRFLQFSILKVFLSLIFLFLFQVKLASAQFFDRYGYGYGSYGSISLADIFDRLDPSTVFYSIHCFNSRSFKSESFQECPRAAKLNSLRDCGFFNIHDDSLLPLQNRLQYRILFL